MRKGLTRYSEYAPSSIPWIGEVPRGWEVRRLKKACRKVITGSTPADEAFDESEEAGGIPWHTPGDFTTGDIQLAPSSKRLHRDTLTEGVVRRFPAGSTLLVGIGATLGKVAVTPHDCSGNQQINCLIPRKETDGRYLAFLLSVLTLPLKVSANAATLGILNQTKTGEFSIPFPPLPEQHAIVAFLDRETAKIDRLKDVRRRQIEVLREQRAAVIHHAVTQGLDPDAPKKDSGIPWLGEVPEHWEMRRLKFLVKCNRSTLTEQTPPDFEISYIDIGNVTSGGKVLEVQEFTFAKAPSRARRRLLPGCTIISTVRTYLKAISYFESPAENLIVSTGFAVLEPRAAFEPRFLYRVVSSEYFIQTVIAESKGVGYPAINASDMVCIPVAFPSRQEQLAILAHIDRETAKIDALIGKYERELELLDEYRSSLISHVVTGKADVRGLVEIEPLCRGAEA